MFGRKKSEPIQTSEPIVNVEVEYKLKSDGYFEPNRKVKFKMAKSQSEDITRITEKVEWFEDKPGQAEVYKWNPNA